MDDPIAPPRYRIEHRDGERPPLILAFALALDVAYARVTIHRTRLQRAGERGEVVLVDQETEAALRVAPLGPA